METGIHELTAGYALDALEADERQVYEAHLRDCAQCQEDLASFWEVTGALALAATGPEPPSELRERIVAAARAETQTVVPFRPRRLQPTRVLAAGTAVAATALIAVGGWAVSLHNRLDDANGRLAAQHASLSVVSDPAARSVSLAKGSGKLVVAPDGRAVMILDGLPPAQPGKAYEVWVIRGTTPTRAGLFSGGGRSLVAVDGNVGTDAVVAVTLEPAGGVDAPTTTPLAASRPV
ncbi:MAG: anti-sigma factor [Gaiellaceae bacterium]